MEAQVDSCSHGWTRGVPLGYAECGPHCWCPAHIPEHSPPRRMLPVSTVALPEGFILAAALRDISQCTGQGLQSDAPTVPAALSQ